LLAVLKAEQQIMPHPVRHPAAAFGLLGWRDQRG
jgi:hypothetical protein